MAEDNSPSLPRFEIVTRELRALGIALTRLPGEYRVNYLNGKDDTAVFGSDLDEALPLGRGLAAAAPAAVVRAAAAYHHRRGRRMTPKAIRRRMIRAHNPLHAGAGDPPAARGRIAAVGRHVSA